MRAAGVLVLALSLVLPAEGFAAAGLPPAQAGSADAYAKVLGKDNEEFARNLSRYGYVDLAEVVLAAIEKSGGAKDLRGALLRLELEHDRARKDPDVEKRIARIEALIEAREEFARAHPGTPEAVEVVEGQLELYRSVGELIIQALQGPEPVQDRAELSKHGSEILQQAVEKLEKRLEELSQAAEGLAPEQLEERAIQRMIAAYGLARTQYFRALLYEPESFERNLIANKALDVLLDFQLEYSDQLLCYEGYIYEGLCHEALGKHEKALESFDEAIKLRETYEKSRSGIFLMAPEAADIVSLAIQQKMLALSANGDPATAAAVAADFRATTPEPWTTLKGLAVLSLQAEAYQALGNQDGLNEVAKTLVLVDPNGPGGARGRELLGAGSPTALGALEVLQLAESSAAREPERAIELCQRAMILARGTADQANLGSRSGLLLGALFAQRGALPESVVVWEGAAQRYSDGKDAPECLWRTINGYLALQGQELRPLYKTLAQERLNELSTRYPQHAYASMAGLIEGQQAEAEQDFARAAAVYERIAPGSSGHEEGLYRAGVAWSKQARKLFQQGQAAEVLAAAKRSEALLLKARPALDAAATKTLEVSVQDRMRGFSFAARMALANLYLQEGVNRSGEVAALLQGLDGELARDPQRTATIWDLRFRALRAQGKLDEAVALLDAQILRDPRASWLESGASALAPVLDQRGQDLLRADPLSSEADRLWSKAASYYLLAVRSQLEGRAAVQVDLLESVADRMLVFGLHFEGVPDTVETFGEWDGKRLSSEWLERAVAAYEAVLPLTPSHRTVIKLARALGFLGRYEEAAARYAELFERESFVNRINNTIDSSVVAAKPELLFAYVEWGVAEREVGAEAPTDTTRLLRASRIFEALVLGTTKESKVWWQSQYYQLLTLMDRGKYEVADVSLASLRLNWEHFDEGKYGFQRRFEELGTQLSKKVFK
ncbi:MAG: hypothetical protein HOP15_17915 [Planctomycetes bacterium]|nr:hypothetical protein [Planctomycetota bacterium]